MIDQLNQNNVVVTAADQDYIKQLLKAERERAIEMQLKINKELAETVTRLELEIARLISA
jgi:anti-sigma-K factor RskA